jgi:hypothetical protein
MAPKLILRASLWYGLLFAYLSSFFSLYNNVEYQVLLQHRASDQSLKFVEEVFSSFGSKYVYLSGEAHDRITADTQAVTHAAFLSMGTAWHANNQFPWEIARWVGGIENVKINITLRIYANKWHVYAGLAILNPAAKAQIRQYAQSVTDLFKLMVEGRREELKQRVKTAGAAVFRSDTKGQDLLLRDEVLDRFSLSQGSREEAPPNNHLSLLAIVDCWSKLGIVPYDHMICSTPVSAASVHGALPNSFYLGGMWSLLCLAKLFRIWLGVTEYLFRNPTLLDEVLDIAIDDHTFRSDDLEFTFAARVGVPIYPSLLWDFQAVLFYVWGHFVSILWKPTQQKSELKCSRRLCAQLLLTDVCRLGPIACPSEISNHIVTGSNGFKVTLLHGSPKRLELETR